MSTGVSLRNWASLTLLLLSVVVAVVAVTLLVVTAVEPTGRYKTLLSHARRPPTITWLARDVPLDEPYAMSGIVVGHFAGQKGLTIYYATYRPVIGRDTNGTINAWLWTPKLHIFTAGRAALGATALIAAAVGAALTVRRRRFSSTSGFPVVSPADSSEPRA